MVIFGLEVKEIKMKSKRKTKCDNCGEEQKSFKFLHKLNGGYFCSVCQRKRREEKREFLRREVLGIKKRSDLMKEWAIKRESEPLPQIKPIKTRLKKKVSALGLYLTNYEKDERYQSLRKQGLTKEQAKERINNLNKQIKQIKEDKKKEISQMEISKKEKAELKKRFLEGLNGK
jgi:hypothetical protein